MGVVWRKPTMKENEQSPLKMERGQEILRKKLRGATQKAGDAC